MESCSKRCNQKLQPHQYHRLSMAVYQELTADSSVFSIYSEDFGGWGGGTTVRGVSAVLDPTLCIIILLHETIFPRLAMQCIVRQVAVEIKRAKNFSRNVRSRDALQCATCFLQFATQC